jgi:hypothetical protein
MADTHLAECDRCQSLVGSMGRVAAVVLQPAQALHDRRPHWWLRWAVPLTAAAAVITVGVAVYRDSGFGVRDSETAAREAGAAGARSQEPPVGQIAVQRADEPAAQPTQPLAKQEQATPQATAPRLKEESAQPPDTARESIQIDADSTRQEQATLNSTASPQAAAATAAPAEGAARRDAAPPPAAPPAAAPPPAAPSVLSTPRIAGLARAVAVQQIASPDPRVRWRIRGAVLEHSVNGGSSWDAVTTTVTAELTAGSAPSSTVCWIVGRAGTVLLSSDGQNWRRVAFPEAADLSSVRATDARTASVTTADGRVFSTMNAGDSWDRR